MRFISELPFFLLPIFGLLAIGLAWFYYSKQSWLKTASHGLKISVISLRSLLLFLIAILLCGIFFEQTIIQKDEPVIVIAKDQSASMVLHADSSEVRKVYQELTKQFQTSANQPLRIVEFNFPEGQSNFDGQTSNLSSPLRQIREMYKNQNLGAIVLLSDGQYNAGFDPIYEVEKYGATPVYTLGFGDTVAKKDQAIFDIAANSSAFYNNSFPVEITVSANGFPSQASEIELLEGGQRIDHSKLFFSSVESKVKVVFNVEAKKKGLMKFQVRLKHLDQEQTYTNNQREFYVDVLEKKQQILLLSSAPHPDISALKSVFENINGIEFKNVLLKDFDGEIKENDLLIVHEPGHPKTSKILKSIQESKVPTWYIIGSGSQPSIINRHVLGVRLKELGQTDRVEPYLEESFQGIRFTDETMLSLADWPPLNTWFGEHQIHESSKVMLRQRIGQVKKKDPLMYYFNDGNKSIGVLLGTGLWRWKLSEFHQKEACPSFTELVDGIAQFLMSDQSKRVFEVNFPARLEQHNDFSGRAMLYNRAGQLVKNAKITVRMKNESGQENIFECSEMDGFYALNAGRLTPGIWEWTATVTHDGKTHSKSGKTGVLETNSESLMVQANHNVLRQMSLLSSGKFYPSKDWQKLVATLKDKNNFVTLAREEKNQKSIIDWWPMLLLIAGLAAAEWVVRRIYGAY